MDENTPSSDEKLWAGFAYLGLVCCVIPTLVIFFLKKDESRLIKFTCLQAIGLWLAGVTVGIVLMTLGHTPVIGMLIGLVHMLISLAFTAYWIYLMIQTFQGKEVEIPYLGQFINDNLMG